LFYWVDKHGNSRKTAISPINVPRETYVQIANVPRGTRINLRYENRNNIERHD